jgi:hypothetical protein
MADDEPIVFARAEMPSSARGFSWGAASGSSNGAASLPELRDRVRFDRRELKHILDLYGAMVMAGEWRDYAIDFRNDVAAFSVFRRSSEIPLYTIEKRPKLRDRQGQYGIIAAGGRVIKRGNELAAVLRVLHLKLLKVVD